MDPIIVAARDTFTKQEESFLAVIAGLPEEAINWRPGPDTNSLAVLVTHTWGSAVMWTALAAGQPTNRDRAREFEAVADARSLAALIRTQAAQVQEALAASDLSAFGRTIRRGGGETVTAAYCFIHSLEHTQEHLGQALLTRQLWEQAQGRQSPAENDNGYRVPAVANLS